MPNPLMDYRERILAGQMGCFSAILSLAGIIQGAIAPEAQARTVQRVILANASGFDDAHYAAFPNGMNNPG
jgi:hypothetical protein